MTFTPHTFLSFVKQTVMGGGRNTDGSPKVDAGYLVDASIMAGAILPTSVTRIADANGYVALNAAAGITAVTTAPFVVPRDYDEATDEFILTIVAKMAGATDVPTLTLDPDRKPVAGASVQLAVITGQSLTTAALSTTETTYTFTFRGQGLTRNQLVKFTLISGAHATDALQVLSISVAYRSTLVSYNETDGASVQVGNPLR